MTIEQLARQTLGVLRLQQDYFRKRTPRLLQESKDAERRLRKACEEILNPATPDLFDAPTEAES